MSNMEIITRVRRYISVMGVLANVSAICVRILDGEYRDALLPLFFLAALVAVNVYGESDYRAWKREQSGDQFDQKM